MTYHHGYRPPGRWRNRLENLRYDLELLGPVLTSLGFFVLSVALKAGCVVLGLAIAKRLGII